MSHPFDLAPLIGQPQTLCRGEVAGIDDEGRLRVTIPGGLTLRCELLQPDTPGTACAGGDAVLVWQDGAGGGVVLGRIGRQAPAPQPVADAAALAARPETLLLEARGDIVLRNGQSRLRLGADGDVEIVCTSFATRSRRLLRLLAPMIKMN
ncbi:hypothetical protein [Mitsuaria sp. GD03876]|uniref:hypothetical protein n=1 Tax=Mitsuaria sp. GD03876 TaxID=2975399 RepID=UPI00244AC52A|nr:hypothetical protein [Mitsuaria sp. GD03876]MDH0868127.1 hypothetical protein [Mitsuaria sp. GD03876]